MADPDPDPAETQRTKELRLLVLQYLHEEGYTEAAHELEQESGLYFDAKHLEDLVQCGAWDDAERYLVGFTNWNENIYSAKIFFAIRYQKYLESRYRHMACEEGQVVADDLEALAPFNKFWAKRAAAIEEIREGESMDTASARNAVAVEIKKLIQANPLLQSKLDFPSIEPFRLKTMMRQSLEQKYSLGNKPELVRDWTLFSDLPCDTSCNGARSGTKEQTTGACRTQNVKQTHKQPLMVKTTKLARGMPDSATTCSKVVGLLYTSNGNVLLALHSNAVHNLWKWQRGCNNKSWQPANEIVLKNDTSDVNPEEATPCIALSQTKFCVMSASGGKVSMFNIMTFQIFHTFMAPPPAATFIAFHPRDINIVALGMEDSSIQIYNLNVEQVQMKLTGHQKMITGLAFSESLNVLVSSGADTQLCIWRIDSWDKINSRYIQPPAKRSGDTRVQFHGDGTQFLVVHSSHLAIYDLKLEALCIWGPKGALPAPISGAVYSCDCLLVYAGFCDGAIGVFEAESLRLLSWMAPPYIPPSIPSVGRVYPIVVAAHPSVPNQIAIGMNDGSVYVLE
ncbi:unnamed protein product [Urochloa decumbens]|uniref:CTLH domain-containing protein n=1 Tax=Urochloa decumbens TaxID=240449 RepID=A0ABC9BQ66_9POAL